MTFPIKAFRLLAPHQSKLPIFLCLKQARLYLENNPQAEAPLAVLPFQPLPKTSRPQLETGLSN
ncbi:hypothetical protein D3C79_1064580 [compost metagenome]